MSSRSYVIHYADINSIRCRTNNGASMHQCLRITEIQSLIFGSLRASECAQLARTCKLFYEQAMDVVWADIDSLIPFVRCVASDALVYTVTVPRQAVRNRPGSRNIDIVSFFNQALQALQISYLYLVCTRVLAVTSHCSTGCNSANTRVESRNLRTQIASKTFEIGGNILSVLHSIDSHQTRRTS